MNHNSLSLTMKDAAIQQGVKSCLVVRLRFCWAFRDATVWFGLVKAVFKDGKTWGPDVKPSNTGSCFPVSCSRANQVRLFDNKQSKDLTLTTWSARAECFDAKSLDWPWPNPCAWPSILSLCTVKQYGIYKLATESFKVVGSFATRPKFQKFTPSSSRNWWLPWMGQASAGSTGLEVLFAESFHFL